MNKEIKEIYLSNLEWIKAHDDIGGVKGNLIFKDNMSCEEYKKLVKSVYFILCNKDYITNLQQEIDKLTAESTEWESKYYDLQQENERLKIQVSAREELYEYSQSRIDKAIEYIKQEEIEITYHELGLHWCNAKEDLLNILQNGSEENEFISSSQQTRKNN